jgi:VIT1/CCC1 family predicted Fe2+/Mn2+ transporter
LQTEKWEATVATFLSKFIFALTFIVPLLLLPLPTAIIISALLGLSLLGIFSFYIAKEQHANPWLAVLEHLVVALMVISIAHYVGDWIGSTFG